MNRSQLLALMPIIVLTLTVLLLMLQASVKRNATVAWVATGVGLLVALWACGFAHGHTQQVTILIQVDDWGLLFSGLVIVAALVAVIISRHSFAQQGDRREEFYLLLILSTIGAIILIQSSHLASLLLGMELMGVALYAIIAFPERDQNSLEAAIKYLLLSASASAMLLLGFALLYAATGELSYSGIGAKAGTVYQTNPALVVGALAMIFAGFGFKLSLVPFHMWTPDVYQGAPSAVTLFLATVSKGAVFVAFSRLFIEANVSQYPGLMAALSVVAIASMLVGNLLALLQDNIKRLLSYSSIAHFGYLLIVLIAASGAGSMTIAAASFYLAAYIVSTLAAFTVIASVIPETDSHPASDDNDADALAGLFWRRPMQALALSVALLSLAGIPLTAGFIGKFYVINAGIGASLWLLLGALVVGSAISIYYYLRIIFVMSKTEGLSTAQGSQQFLSQDVLAGVLLLSIVALGSWPQPFIGFLAGL
jgi:NADH-quinone oxidoreductase subunit N